MTNRKRPAEEPDPLDREIDFRGGVRGKYYKRYMEGTNIVLLEPDVAKEFLDFDRSEHGAPTLDQTDVA